MVIAGLTGPFASGKSTLLRLLAEKGAQTYSADVSVHALYQDNAMVQSSVVERFGVDVVAGDGSINRGAVAQIAFADQRARTFLEELLHPLVREEFWTWCGSLKPDDVGVAEIPLLVESHWRGFDYVIAVECDASVSAPLLQGFDATEITRRRAAQQTPEARRAIADVVIENDGSLERLVGEAQDIWQVLKQLPARTANVSWPGPPE